jgi:hypothetical protein
MTRMVPARVLGAALAAVLTFPAAGGAQSLFSTRGLGVPVAPLDARSRALGGVSLGLLGWSGALGNPAEAAGIPRRGIVAAVQPSRRSVTFEGQEDRLGGTRFPLVQAVLPFGERLAVSVGYGGFLDQSWSVVSEDTVIVGGEPLRALDLIDSDGGAAQARLDVAYLISPSLAVGLGAGVYTGRLERVVSRSFPDANDIEGLESRTAWNYSGPLIAAGAWWEPVPIARLAASVTWSGELRADAEDELSSDLRVKLPLQVAVGASGRLSSRLLGVVGGRWAGWSSAADAFDEPDAAADVWEVGAGIEWTGSRALSRPLPLRLGFHYGALPFRVRGATPREWAVAFGVGSVLAGDERGPRAALDLAVERGSRGDAATTGLTESFWRFTISLALFGQ